MSYLDVETRQDLTKRLRAASHEAMIEDTGAGMSGGVRVNPWLMYRQEFGKNAKSGPEYEAWKLARKFPPVLRPNRKKAKKDELPPKPSHAPPPIPNRIPPKPTVAPPPIPSPPPLPPKKQKTENQYRYDKAYEDWARENPLEIQDTPLTKKEFVKIFKASEKAKFDRDYAKWLNETPEAQDNPETKAMFIKIAKHNEYLKIRPKSSEERKAEEDAAEARYRKARDELEEMGRATEAGLERQRLEQLDSDSDSQELVPIKTQKTKRKPKARKAEGLSCEPKIAEEPAVKPKKVSKAAAEKEATGLYILSPKGRWVLKDGPTGRRLLKAQAVLEGK